MMIDFSCKSDFTCCKDRKSALTLFNVELFRPYICVSLIRDVYFSFTSSVISCSFQLFGKCCTTREKPDGKTFGISSHILIDESFWANVTFELLSQTSQGH